LTLKNKLGSEYASLLSVAKSSGSIAVHIRRDDYLKKRNQFVILNKEYYLDAVNKITQRVKKPKYLIFTEDEEWVKENILPIVGKNGVIVPTNKSFPEKDLYLMSQCKNFIIANSTFSWWGAYLSKNKNKIVIAPKKWSIWTTGKDVCPKSWILL